MKKNNMKKGCKSTPGYDYLEEWVRLKVQEFIQEILEEEVEGFLGRKRYERRKGVDCVCGWRNGYGKPRRFALKTGTIEIRRPRLRNLEERFQSRIIPLFQRRTKEVGELMMELYLHGLSKGDFELALRGLLGDSAPLSRTSIQRLKAKWEREYSEWKEKDLSNLEVVYLWADGIFVKAGIGRDKAALLVVIGVLKDGQKKILAVESGWRESKESWAEVLRDLKRRGLRAPKLLIADGHLGIWGALAEIWPETKEQRCWNHKILNVLDKLPKSVQARAREYLCKIPYAESRRECERLKEKFKRIFADDYPKAVEVLERDWERMITFYEFPKEHWRHIRTTNVVESPFSAVRLRTDVARRFKNVKNAECLIWKVLMVAEKRFRKLSAPELLVDVYNGVKYVDGKREEERKTLEGVAA